jgi:hypothetical protein
MLSGVPVAAVRWNAPGLDWRWLHDLWEANDIIDLDPIDPRMWLENCLISPFFAEGHSADMRRRAIELFDVATVGAQWKAFLG